MRHNKQLSPEEREKIKVYLEQGLSLAKIGDKISRDKSVISRELSRNTDENGEYVACNAQKKAEQRKKHCGAKRKLENAEAREYVAEKLEKAHWSPEQIAERAKLEKKPFSLCYSTIYRGIDSGVLPKATKENIPVKRKYKSRKAVDNRGQIPNRVNIRQRPKEVEKRSTPGHWESDTVLGKRGTGCIGTHVERKSGFLIAFYLADKQSGCFTNATIDAFKTVPDKLKKSFTVDNGKEFACHETLSEKTGMGVYFCDPYSFWQRGTNENTNGLLRRFFPKKTSFANISTEDVNRVVSLINNRPRKRLGFRTPYEILQKYHT